MEEAPLRADLPGVASFPESEPKMNPIATYAAHFMDDHPDPALRLGELLPPVAERVDRSLSLQRLRSALAEYPDTFRLLDPWTGPWRWHDEPERDFDADVWVVLLTGSGPTGPEAGGPVGTLRESVRWLARGIDERSALSVSRWYAIALMEREARRALAG